MEHLILFLTNLVIDISTSTLFEYFIYLFMAQAFIYILKEMINIW